MTNPTGNLPHDEVTPYPLYVNRRQFLRGVATVGSVAATAGAYRWFNPLGRPGDSATKLEGIDADELAQNEQQQQQGFLAADSLTSEEDVISYNNFYEFTTSKTRVARAARNFQTAGWKLVVDGLVQTPRTFSLTDLQALGPLEERVYRMRCVEAWSMVIPWAGIPLSRLLEAVQPTSAAKYVAFETLYDPDRMPGQQVPVLAWPYREGLTLAEAMHPLTLLALGLYRKELPPQNGSPVRLVVPWKYGFKGIKSIVRISLVDAQPVTSWNDSGPLEYGFYANVNPQVDHPRWSQATEQRIGEFGRRQTLLFNGYEEQVGDLYTGLDLRVNY